MNRAFALSLPGFLFVLSALCEPTAPAGPGLATPEFHADGSVSRGAKSVRLRADGQIVVVLGARQAMLINQQMAIGARGWSYPPYCKGRSLSVDESERVATFTGKWPLTRAGEGPYAEYRASLRLLADGLIRLECVYSFPEGLAEDVRKVRYDHLLFDLPFGVVAGRSVRIDDEQVRFSAAGDPLTDKSKYVFGPKNVTRLEFFADEPDRHLAVGVEKGRGVFVREQRLRGSQGNQCAIVGVSSRNAEIALTFDIRRASPEALAHSRDYFEGIDFYKSDRLHIPRYGLCRNLVQNSSFEAGLRYWRYSATWPAPELFPEPYVIDEGVARTGSRSVRLNVEKGRRLRGLATFAIPTEPGKSYTFSFHAKAAQPGASVAVGPTTALWGVFPNGKTFAIGLEWGRHSYTFTAPNNGVVMRFHGLLHGGPRECGRFWVDDVQFEKGELTEYVRKPVGLELVTNRRDHFFEPGEVMNARLVVKAAPQASGELSVQVEDFGNRVVWQGDFPVKCGADGKVEVRLPLDGRLPRGIFYVQADVAMADGFGDRDFFRITVVDFLEGRHKHRMLFGSSPGDSFPEQPRFLRRIRRIGIGSVYDRPRDKSWYDSLAAQGIEPAYTNLFPGKRAGKLNFRDLWTQKELTPEQERIIREHCRETVLARPWLKRWKLLDEPPSTTDSGLLAQIAEVAYKAVKEANPEALVLTHTPCNMSPNGGIRDVDKYLAAGGAKYMDIVGINCYRHQPDNPDLDADVRKFLEMLAKHGYEGEIHLCGSYHQNYNLPAYGLDAHKGCSSDHFRLGAFSYHGGWGERLCAAYTARSWLIGLKYGKRVRTFVDWVYSGRHLLDIDMVPYALSVVPNTLGVLLGNADFVEDVIFDGQVRCYLFQDEHDRPVAALWPLLEAVARREQAPPVLRLSGVDPGVEALTLMGAPTDCVEGDALTLPLGPAPVFLRGPPGSLAALRETLRAARVTGVTPQIARVLTRNVGTAVEVVFLNPLSRALSGRARATLGDRTVFDEALALGPKAERTFRIDIADRVRPTAFARAPLAVLFQADGAAEPLELDAAFTVFGAKRAARAITADGDLADWQGLPALELGSVFYECDVPTWLRNKFPDPVPWGGPKDLSVRLQAAWDEENLYLAFVVSDDVFKYAAAPGPGSWQGDCLQLYFDTWCDARAKSERGFDYNDYNYDICPGADGSCVAFRRVAPEQQLAFLKTNVFEEAVACVCRREEGRTIYEVAFPKRYLQPIALEPGAAFGFAAFVPDHDGDYLKRGLTMTMIPQTSPYMRPHLWPVLVLIE